MAVSQSPEPRAPRRRWPLSEKRRIVELTLCEGASVGAIARQYGVNRNSLYQWQALYRAEKLNGQRSCALPTRGGKAGARFLPVMVAATERVAPAHDALARRGCIAQLVLPSGASLRIETDVLDAGVLCALLEQVQR